MHSEPTLTIESDPKPADRSIVERGLEAFNHQHAGDSHHQPLCVFVRDGAGNVLGGLLGDTYYGWLAINLLWLDEAWRGHGYGRMLLRAAEAEAIRRGCRHAHVDTLSFQALDFYLSAGYIVFGELAGLPPGHTRYFLQKPLAAHGS